MLFEARRKPGGLNEFGIASYKATDGFAQAEVDWLLQIGGITVETGRRLGQRYHARGAAAEYDAVFLGIGLAGVNALAAEGATASMCATRSTSSPICGRPPIWPRCRWAATWWSSAAA